MASKPTGRPRGRPRKYKGEETDLKAYFWCLEHGGNRRDLSNHLRIAPVTLSMWLHDYPTFLASVHRGEDEWVQAGCPDIVKSMSKRAREHATMKRVVKKEWDKEAKDWVVVSVTETTEVKEGQQRAAEFMLINRDVRWRKPQDHLKVDGPAVKVPKLVIMPSVRKGAKDEDAHGSTGGGEGTDG